VPQVGQDGAARSAAASHTAALAGGGAASSAFLRQAGVAEVHTLAELIETLKIFHVHGPQIGPRLCSLSCSGGEAGLVADLAAPFGHDIRAPFRGRPDAALGEILGPIVSIANPLDYHTFIWGDGPRTTAVFTTMLQDYDLGIYLLDPPRPDRCDPASFQPALDAIVAGGPGDRQAGLSGGLAARELRRGPGHRTDGPGHGGADGPGSGAWRHPRGADTGRRAGLATGGGCPPRETVTLSETEGKALLAAAGVAVPRGVSAPTLAGLQPEAGSLHTAPGTEGPGLPAQDRSRRRAAGPGRAAGTGRHARRHGYLAEEMATGAVAEVLLGLRRDPVYGLSLTLGMGGVTAELLADTVTLILPASPDELLAGIAPAAPVAAARRLPGSRTRPTWRPSWPWRTGIGGADAGGRDLEEIEINPVLVRADGAVAVDALIRKAL
jgi:hypothetical protein